ncbi:MAG: DUF1080 domain-containing protein [bacterium]|nr:DUF1080 domain-containing protein [bacterium]
MRPVILGGMILLWLFCSILIGQEARPKPADKPTTQTAKALASESPFIGQWALQMPDGAAGWLDISMTEDRFKVELWTVGSPKNTQDVQFQDGRLSFVRTCAIGPAEYPGGPPSGAKIPIKHRATVDGDSLRLVMGGPTAEEQWEERVLVGKRMPPIPPRPDLKKIKFGDPIVLFNGRDLSGWRLTNPEQINGWKVIDGVLTNVTPKTSFEAFGRYGNLRTEEEFEDFRLTLEFNVPAGGNSGVYLRGMYEAQVVDRDSRMQGIQGVGAVFGRIEPNQNAGMPGGQWQAYELTLVDRHISVRLNGHLVIDNQPILGCTNGALSADVTQPGPIYLQGDHTAVQYRNLVLHPVIP